ncbi:hypothetical protein [Mesorhizobium sp. KR1-2]|uniref:hypothetical protein n=1 Tax=Mesorhizobium sp. KR1-2 TaxID=3156609 RepID=UPI0032B4C582
MKKFILPGAFVPSFCCALEVLAQTSGFQNHNFNGREPTFRGSETEFLIRNGDCSSKDYGDGRGESNCLNGNVSSRLAERRHSNRGEAVEYSFEFKVDPSFSYRGNRLEIALWQRVKTIKNHIYELGLNATAGATFEGRRCVPANRLAEWNRFSMRVVWRSDGKGSLSVSCNAGEIYRREGNVLIPEGCGSSRKPECDPQKQRLEQPIQFQIGPLMRGYGGPQYRGNRSSPFERFQENGIRILVRDLRVQRRPG